MLHAVKNSTVADTHDFSCMFLSWWWRGTRQYWWKVCSVRNLSR